MKLLLAVFVSTLAFGLIGCGRDPALSPPVNGTVIPLRLKVPETLSLRPVQVIYRSTLCTFTDISASGKRYPRDGYQNLELQLVRQGNSDFYETNLPVDGGGDCQWKLSNVTFGVKHAVLKQFGGDVSHGAGGGVIVIFDRNNSGRGAADFKVDGDLNVEADYYPWLSESFLGGYRKRISLFSGGDIFLMYQALSAEQIYFDFKYHMRYPVFSVEPGVKKAGNHVTFNYPDGTSTADRRWQPDFRKLQSIRHNAESQP